jgi:hypothetical protein
MSVSRPKPVSTSQKYYGLMGRIMATTTSYAITSMMFVLTSATALQASPGKMFRPPEGNCPGDKKVTPPSEFIYKPISSDYPGILAQNVSGIDKFCTWKTIGMNKGRICCWNNEWHYMKNENSDMDRLIELYNIMLVRDTLGALVPDAQYIFNENTKLILETKGIENFRMAESLLPETFDKNHFSEEALTKFRGNVVAYIGEASIAKLYVVSTFIGDITAQNWGSSFKKLVFVDVDGGKNKNDGSRLQPDNLPAYLQMSRNALIHDHTRIALSLQNLMDMKTLYEEMLGKALPKLHPSVDMQPELFNDILSRYIRIFDSAITYIKNQYPTIDNSTPDLLYNNILGGYFTEEIKLVKNASSSGEVAAPVNTLAPASSSTGIMASLRQAIANVSSVVNTTLNNTLTIESVSKAAAVILASDTAKNIAQQLQTPQIASRDDESRLIDIPANYAVSVGAKNNDISSMLFGSPSLFLPIIGSAITLTALVCIAINRKRNNKNPITGTMASHFKPAPLHTVTVISPSQTATQRGDNLRLLQHVIKIPQITRRTR